MTIKPGTRLGPYEVVAPIGAGGMGEVWRAKDTRLDREVAIKVLPPGFARNARFLQRFDREARAISKLNHPHVCTLHDVGTVSPLPGAGGEEAADLHYLVMELLEGESLADRLRRGPLPLADVFRLGRQIASALDAAHRHGITHRDLKPGNIMLAKTVAEGQRRLCGGARRAHSPPSGPRLGSTPPSALGSRLLSRLDRAKERRGAPRSEGIRDDGARAGRTDGRARSIVGVPSPRSRLRHSSERALERIP